MRRNLTAFIGGLLLGLLFIAYRVTRYSGGPREEELPIYLVVVLAFGGMGIALTALSGWLVGRFRRRK